LLDFKRNIRDEILTPVQLTSGTGFFGPSTRAKLSALYGDGGDPGPTPSTFQFTDNLTVGSRGEQVTELQELLIKEGVYPEAMVTGYFGPLTKAAVIRFQEKYSSEVLTPVDLTQGTGFVGSSTRKKLNSLL
jgi:peptidoglycan hydrolase-like protein with peptidoglycan-binding domain